MDEIASSLPPIVPFDYSSLTGPIAYVGAASFEKRATTVADSFLMTRFSLERALAIRYCPHGDPRNRVRKFGAKLRRICPKVTWMDYNRLEPQEFQKELAHASDIFGSDHIVVDISGMSKFLIVVLLQSLVKLRNSVTLVYGEAEVYYPTKEEFERKRAKLKATPDFLTTDVFTILQVMSLSSVSMQGYPILLMVFPTFNHYETVALHNEINPQHMILLEGVPHLPNDYWRLDAVREINRNLYDNPDYNCTSKTLNTFNYLSNVKTLEEIYQSYCFTHKILLAPTGSKLQAVASFVFKQLHPDVQIVYPVTKSFIGKISDGCKAMWAISFNSFSASVSSLARYRFEDFTRPNPEASPAKYGE